MENVVACGDPSLIPKRVNAAHVTTASAPPPAKKSKISSSSSSSSSYLFKSLYSSSSSSVDRRSAQYRMMDLADDYLPQYNDAKEILVYSQELKL